MYVYTNVQLRAASMANQQRERLDSVIWKLAVPLALSLGLEPLCACVDTYAVGKRMGPRSLSAFALADRVHVIGCVRGLHIQTDRQADRQTDRQTRPHT